MTRATGRALVRMSGCPPMTGPTGTVAPMFAVSVVHKVPAMAGFALIGAPVVAGFTIMSAFFPPFIPSMPTTPPTTSWRQSPAQ